MLQYQNSYRLLSVPGPGLPCGNTRSSLRREIVGFECFDLAPLPVKTSGLEEGMRPWWDGPWGRALLGSDCGEHLAGGS